jgi:DNA polymerase I-like protein with 3'-5' exonuclease and polymerase domains
VQVGIDASGLEARMLANRMAPFDNLEYGLIILNGDIHESNRKAAGLSTRDQAKTFFYGLIYGAGNQKIGELIGKGAYAGGSLKKRFLENIPAIKKVIDACEFQVADKETITLLDGREVPCRTKHVALNVQLQGDGAVIMKLALCILIDKLKEHKGKWGLMATVHDEWQFECAPEFAEELGAIGCSAIKEAGVRLGCLVRLDGEYSIGKDWSECH